MELNAVVTEPSGNANPTELVFVHGAWHGSRHNARTGMAATGKRYCRLALRSLTGERNTAALLSQDMPTGQPQELSVSITPFRLSDLIAAASSPDPINHEDGSITIYVRLIPSERFSMLPRPVRKSRRNADELTARANVRRVPRRSTTRR